MRAGRAVALLYLVCALGAACPAAEVKPKPKQEKPKQEKQEKQVRITVAPFDVDQSIARRVSVKVSGEPVENAVVKILELPQMKGTSTKVDLRGIRGKRVSVNVKDTPMGTVMAMIARETGVNLYRSGDKLILSPPQYIRIEEMKATPFILLWSPQLKEPIWKRQADALAYEARMIGIKRERAQARALLGYLYAAEFRATKYYLPAEQALMSLARLGDSDALEHLHRLVKNPATAPPALAPYYRVALARIQAEAAPASGSAADRLASHLKKFLRFLALTPQQVESTARRRSAAVSRDHGGLPLGVLAIRQMADMVASALMTGGDTSAAEKVINFSVDPPAEAKVQLAALAPHERAPWLVKRVGSLTALDEDAYRLIQALGDEGAPAAEATGRRLREISASRERVAQANIGIQALLKALLYAGGPKDAPFAEAFMHDKDQELAGLARAVAWGLRAGTKQVYAPEY
jgi:hypothetical protein